MKAKSIDEMSDDEILEAAGDCGPAIIGKELFERAEHIKRVNPGGVLGPAIVGDTKPVKASKPKAPAKPVKAAPIKVEGAVDTTAKVEDREPDSDAGEAGEKADGEVPYNPPGGAAAPPQPPPAAPPAKEPKAPKAAKPEASGKGKGK